MFSLFQNGITDTTPSNTLDINTLIQLIRNNPQVSKIETIRKMKAEGSCIRKLKNTLPNITTGAIVTKRNSQEIILMSGYLYFDIDNIENVFSYKQKLIDSFGSIITMLCISCSGTGLSMLVKPAGITITKENFSAVRQFVYEKYFHDLNLDCNTKDVSRTWFISSDSDVYYNPDSTVEIEKGITAIIYNPTNRLTATIPKSEVDFDYNFKHISEVQKVLKFSTDVEVTNRIFDVKPIDYCKVVVPKDYRIPTGKKTATFVRLIHNLVYLNPGVEPIYIMSYLNYINNFRTVKKAIQRDWVDLFNRVYNCIIETGNIEPSLRIKFLHFKKKTISTSQKNEIVKEINGLIRKENSINKISLAKDFLRAQGVNATQKSVFELINNMAKETDCKGISMPTIKRRWNDCNLELRNKTEELNMLTPITYIDKSIVDSGVSDTRILDESSGEYKWQALDSNYEMGYLKRQMQNDLNGKPAVWNGKCVKSSINYKRVG